MEEKDLIFIQDQIAYNFNNLDLLQQAFVRRSYAKENGGEDNEVLEFIGDKVLDFIVVKFLTEEYGYFLSECDDFDKNEEFDEFATEYNENRLTEIKKKLVQKKTLASRIDMLGLAEYLIMGKGDIKNGVNEEASVKEDLFEAILGAVALDSQWNISELQDVVDIMLSPDSILTDNADLDYVGLIQDWTCKNIGTIPLYHFEKYYRCSYRSNLVFENNRIDEKQFHCILTIDDNLPEFVGDGVSKSEARKAVCKAAYDYLEENDLTNSIRNEIRNPNKAEAINQLETLARRGYFSIPTYKFYQEYDKNGNPIWKCRCFIVEKKKSFLSRSSSKKEAKKSSAYRMLKYLLEEDGI
ncbi:MAG: hypothetical protein HFG34_10335 [Eubacterium sp.]|nr:hypothetical protein [Eubacterium sp.]